MVKSKGENSRQSSSPMDQDGFQTVDKDTIPRKARKRRKYAPLTTKTSNEYSDLSDLENSSFVDEEITQNKKQKPNPTHKRPALVTNRKPKVIIVHDSSHLKIQSIISEAGLDKGTIFAKRKKLLSHTNCK